MTGLRSLKADAMPSREIEYEPHRYVYPHFSRSHGGKGQKKQVKLPSVIYIF